MPHFFNEDYIFILLTERALHEKFKSSHRMNQFINTSLNYEKRAIILIESLANILHIIVYELDR